MNTNNIIGHYAVQGEEAVLSAMPANIWRMYATTDSESNLLAGLNLHITEDGSAYYDETEAKTDEERSLFTKKREYNKKIFDEMASAPTPDDYIKKIAVGIHRNAQIVSGFSCTERDAWTQQPNNTEGPCKGCKVSPNKQHKGWCRIHNHDDSNELMLSKSNPRAVNQVCCAGLDLWMHRSNQSYSSSRENDERCAEMILQAMYEGTIRAAVYCESTTVHLTMVGCGSFGNKYAWVAGAIERMKGFIIDKGLDVTVVFMHDGKLPINDNPDFQIFAGIATDIVHIDATGKHAVMPQAL